MLVTAVAFVVLLGVLITVHELGHFLVAKACGVKVLTFSIGFGPKLIGFTRGDTEYRISALPLGGYVRMFGDDVTQDIPPEQQREAFLYQPFLKKTAIAFAGPLANLILPVVIFFTMFVGTETVPEAVVGAVIPGGPAASAGLEEGDRVVALDGKPVRYWHELTEYVQPRALQPIDVSVVRGDDKLTLKLTPEASPAPTIFERDRKVGLLGLLNAKQLPFVVVAPESAAAVAGVQDLDKVLRVNDKPVATKRELFAALDGAVAAGGPVKLDVEREVPVKKEDGKTEKQKQQLALTIASPAAATAAPAPAPDVAFDRFGVTADELAPGPLRDRIERTRALVNAELASTSRRLGLAPIDGLIAAVAEETVAAEKKLTKLRDRIVAVDGKPVYTHNDLTAALDPNPDGVHVVGVVGGGKARVLAFRMLPHPERAFGGIKVIGVALSADGLGPGAQVERTVTPADALRRAVDATGKLVLFVFKGFRLLFTGQVGVEAIGGPGTIAKLAGEAASDGVGQFVELMALISVNLAVLNLLPIPVLDGGHIMLFTVELITRRRLSAATRMKVTKVGLVIVGILMVIAIGNDILGLF